MKEVFREIKREIEFYSTSCLDYAAHVHEDIELVYVKEGGGTAYCDGKKYHLTPRSFFLVFPNQVHHYTDCNKGEYVLLIVKPTSLLSHNEIYMKGYPVSALYTADSSDNTPHVLNLALEEYLNNDYSTVVEAYLTALFEKLLQHYEIEKGKVANDTVLRVLQYCTTHYKEDITVSDVADHLQISRSSVSHIFSLRLAVSFNDHINALRLLDAVHLLKNKDYSMTEIAAIAGFPTIRTFNRVFSKHYGMTPTEYRKELTE